MSLSFRAWTVEWASGLPSRHSWRDSWILALTYLKNVGMNADMAGRRPTPPSKLEKLIGIRLKPGPQRIIRTFAAAVCVPPFEVVLLPANESPGTLDSSIT